MPTSPPPEVLAHLSAEHHQLWAQADAFAAEHIAPRIRAMESDPHKVERTAAQLIADQGWLGVTVPRQYGGMAAG
ncbi:acyl-CoA dehydrogenase family protein, partial [Streptomyces sp. NPDC090106]|uniref:acyl-CoA dehydrogenase family protein n=1 Tax=Streptomyces sp. NPDC090106 TaxID=3365946 RepID=UPI0037F22057